MVPSLSFAFRLLLLVRTAAAMYSIISDCDEGEFIYNPHIPTIVSDDFFPPFFLCSISVFNFWEPLHYFQHNSGFQTWEQSPQFAVRSWAYILLHWPLAHLGPKALRLGKRQQFFALRICLGAISSFAEASFFRAVAVAVNERVGRYVLFSMLLSAGMWSASVGKLRLTRRISLR